MERIKQTTETYETYDPEYLVDIVSGSKLYHAWLYHKRCGIKVYLFGINKKDITKQDFIETVDVNIKCQNYIEQYHKEYMTD